MRENQSEWQCVIRFIFVRVRIVRVKKHLPVLYNLQNASKQWGEETNKPAQPVCAVTVSHSKMVFYTKSSFMVVSLTFLPGI